jgi:thiol-disulfide isomerase/thioredoxin
MPRNPVGIAVAALALAAVVLTFKAYLEESGGLAGVLSGPAMLAGAPAESYPVKDLAGESDALEHYRGHVVLVNLWASWCAPCRSETPALEALYEAERGKGLVVLGIDQGESVRAAAAFAGEMKLHYPILLDEDQRYGRAYAAVGLPTTLVVDRSGHIVRGIDGEMTLGQMRAVVGPVLRAQE